MDAWPSDEDGQFLYRSNFVGMSSSIFERWNKGEFERIDSRGSKWRACRCVGKDSAAMSSSRTVLWETPFEFDTPIAALTFAEIENWGRT